MTNAIAGIDLVGSKQMVVVTDHDSKVIARRTFRCRAWDLGAVLDWASGRAAAGGWAGITVACEPTGHRWRVVGQLAADRAMPFVCVQPVVSSWSRRTEDLTFDKTDDKDAVLIARLTAQLRCYVPEPVDETWARLRYLGIRREQLLTEAGSQVQQMRDLLECAWPAALDAARQPFRSVTWTAALAVITGRDGADLSRTRRLGPAHEHRNAASCGSGAIDRFGRTSLRVDLARAHLLYGEWLRRAHRRIEAREQLRTAHHMLTTMGADGFAERAVRELRATGERVRKRTSEPAAQLTAREDQIARLADDGLSNPEIAAQLFMSPRTVEYHLHKVFTKLAISSRNQLHGALAQSGRRK